VNLITLVPNSAGYGNFLALGLGPDGCNHNIGLFFSALEAHNRANLGQSIEESIEQYEGIARDGRARGIRLVGYVSAAFGYREPGKKQVLKAAPDKVSEYIDRLFGMGADVVTLSDLQGVADENRTREFWEEILGKRKGMDIRKLGYHPHHIYGHNAVSASLAVYSLGIRRFDSSIGGTGGCVTGAPGNQPTELLVSSFHASGVETGIVDEKLRLLTDAIHERLYSVIPMS
jgi:hydroxymethylglutaryl-CoA lyase